MFAYDKICFTACMYVVANIKINYQEKKNGRKFNTEFSPVSY